MAWLCKLGFHRIVEISAKKTNSSDGGVDTEKMEWDFVCSNCGMKVMEHIPAVVEAERIINRRV